VTAVVPARASESRRNVDKANQLDKILCMSIDVTREPSRPTSPETTKPAPVATVRVAVSAEAEAASQRSAVRFGGGTRWALAADGSSPSPMEALLASLAACQVLTYQHWAARLGIALGHCEVTVSGDFDPRGFQGDPAASGVGFSDLALAVRLEGSEPTARYEELAEAVDRHCPVHDSLCDGVRITRRLEVRRPD
jgi:uncharacterized OsmC-like protein